MSDQASGRDGGEPVLSEIEAVDAGEVAPAVPTVADERSGGKIVVVTPQGMSVADVDDKVADLIEQPAKVMRIGSMIKQLLEEVRSAPMDEQGRARLAEVHERSILELQSGLAPELVEELQRITLPFSDERTPSDAELRVAQAQLVGWLEGLFHGIQTALFAQQMAARAQFEDLRRRALPPGSPGLADAPGVTPEGTALPPGGTGNYL